MRHSIWGRHPIHKGYLVSIDGEVFREERKDVMGRKLPSKYLSISVHKHGYTQVGLGYRPRKTANLVAETHLADTKTLYRCQVLHRNDMKADSRLENLYYGSYEDNLADAIRNNKRVYHVHENCDKAKWKSIRVYGKGIDKTFPNIKEAMKFIGVSASAVSQALKKKSKTGGYNVQIQNSEVA